jgi:hypothetical protein
VVRKCPKGDRVAAKYGCSTKRDLMEPGALLFVGGSKISAAVGDGIEYLRPISRLAEAPPLSETAAVKPPFLTLKDPWFVETKQV